MTTARELLQEAMTWIHDDPHDADARDLHRRYKDFLAQPEPEPKDYVYTVPNHCDRIIWREQYIHLPIVEPAAQPEPAAPVMDACNDVRSSSPTSGGGFSYTVGGGTLNTAPAKPEPSVEVELLNRLRAAAESPGTVPQNYHGDLETEAADALERLAAQIQTWKNYGELQYKRAEAAEKLYNELLFLVGKKFPDESRHETAARYTRNAEAGTGSAAIAQEKP